MEAWGCGAMGAQLRAEPPSPRLHYLRHLGPLSSYPRLRLLLGLQMRTFQGLPRGACWGKSSLPSRRSGFDGKEAGVRASALIQDTRSSSGGIPSPTAARGGGLPAAFSGPWARPRALHKDQPPGSQVLAFSPLHSVQLHSLRLRTRWSAPTPSPAGGLAGPCGKVHTGLPPFRAP